MAQSQKNNEEQQSEEAHLSNDLHDTNAIVKTDQITEFVDEASIKATTYTASSKVVEDPYITQDLITFLQRPFPLTVVKWQRTSVQGSCIYRVAFPDALFDIPAVWSKLQNFQYMRAGVQLSIRINATAFHYGKLLGVWRPLSIGFSTHGAATNQPCTSYDNLYSLSSYPHILISPTSTETSILKADYALPLDWIDMDAFAETDVNKYRRLFMTLGVFELWVLNPLKAMNSENDPPAYITLFSQFTNIKLAGFSNTARTYKSRTLGSFSNMLMPTGVVFSRGLPISQALDMDQNNGNVLPGIRKIAYWPQQIPNSDVALPAMSLSLVQKCSHRPVKPANLDLLAFLSKPCLLKQFEITNISKTGTALLVLPVMPYLHPQRTDGNKDMAFHTRLSFISSMFELWRGTLRYHFNIVCSKFHSLRIRVYWVPGRSLASTNDGVIGPCLTINKVIDVQGECDFFFDVPWLNAFQNLATHSGMGNGTLVFDLLNPIVYPEQNIPPVQVNVWISAGPDFELAKLRAFEKLDFNAIFWTNSALSTLTDDSLPHAQGSEPNQTVDGGPVAGHDTSMVISPLVGEKISSLRQIIDKPAHLVGLASRQYLYYAPPVMATGKIGTRDVRFCKNWLDYLHLVFVGSSGALEFLNPIMKSGIWVSHSDTRNETYYRTGETSYKNLADMFKDRSSGNFCFFEPSDDQRAVILPYYSNLAFKPLQLLPGTLGLNEAVYPVLDTTYMDATEGDKIELMIRAGNSFNFHLPIGVPAMLSYVPTS